MKLIKIGAVVALLAVAACAGDTATRATNALAIACESYATAGDQLVPLKRQGKLSANMIARVDAANKVVTPVCSKQDAVIDPATAIGIVEQGIALLNQVKSSF